MKPDSEKILKEAAKLYVAQIGGELLKERDGNAAGLHLDDKYRRRISRHILLGKARKAVFIAAPIAASLLIAMLFVWPFGSGSPEDAPSSSEAVHVTPVAPAAIDSYEVAAAEGPADAEGPAVSEPVPPLRTEIAFLSTRLPEGYVLTQTDYDFDKTIYFVNNRRNNEIVLVAEPAADFFDDFEKAEFVHTVINGTDAYMLVRKEFNVLLLQSEGLLYTFTSPFDARDLIEMAEAIV